MAAATFYVDLSWYFFLSSLGLHLFERHLSRKVNTERNIVKEENVRNSFLWNNTWPSPLCAKYVRLCICFMH